MYLGMPYTLTESRVLFEIAREEAAEVARLRQALDIDAGYAGHRPAGQRGRRRWQRRGAHRPAVPAAAR
jgi:hypothetical protein